MKLPKIWGKRQGVDLILGLQSYSVPFILLLFTVISAQAQVLPTAATQAQSASGQFTVIAPPQNYHPASYSGTNANVIRLEPAMVAMSAERIRQSVWRELGVTGQWQHKIFVSLYAVTPWTGQNISISTDLRSSGWSYRISIPNQITRERYLRVMTQMILLELANRSASLRSAEIPAWLSDGLAFQMLANNSDDLILTPPRHNIGGIFLTPSRSESQRVSSVERAHKILFGEIPLSFEELSWPTDSQLDGPDTPRFMACSQLFTRRLLDFQDGQRSLRDFIRALPGYLNWQMAFLATFKKHFSSPLEIEKWWALQASEFSGRDLIQTWTYEESWNKLSAAVHEPVSVHDAPDELPVSSEVSLQTIIRDWNGTKQRDALQNKMNELDLLRNRIAPELAGLATEYRQSLGQCIRQQSVVSQTWSKRGAPGLGGKNPLTNVKQFDVLDSRLEKLRPGVAPGRMVQQ